MRKREIRKPRLTVTGRVQPVDTSYARRLGFKSRDLEPAETHCSQCGHRASDHGLENLSPEERWRLFNPFKPDRDPPDRRPDCRWPGCGCQAWTPGHGMRTLHESYSLLRVRGSWLEAPLGNRWIAAYRLALQGGQPVVAELRVFPGEPGRPGPGRWSGEPLGIAARVPRGGVTARLLQRVRVGQHLRFTAQVLRDWRRKFPEAFQPGRMLEMWGRLKSGSGPLRPGPRRGRRGRPARFFAEVAAAYVKAVQTGSDTPVADVAQGRRCSAAQVRDMIHRARALGLLTTTRRGVRGGALTDHARALLRQGGKGRTR